MTREFLRMVVAGGSDHGKSTLIGRLLLETRSLPSGKLKEIENVSKQLGIEAELAFVCDQFLEEREEGMTFDTTQTFFRTRRREFTIIDVPGHAELIVNMITGASRADFALLVVDALEGPTAQTSRHMYILNFIGIKRIAVVVNKMDLVDYREEAFQKIKSAFLVDIQRFDMKVDFFVPVSAKLGKNISRRSREMSWYREASLLDKLDRFSAVRPDSQKPLRFPVQDSYEMEGRSVIVGRLSSGRIRSGERVRILPSCHEVSVGRIFKFPNEASRAFAGESVGLVLDPAGEAARGDVLAADKEPFPVTERFRANVFWLAETPLAADDLHTLRLATQEIDAAVESMNYKMNPAGPEFPEEKPAYLCRYEAGSVIFKCGRLLVAETFHETPELGRFVIEDENGLKGVAIITQTF